MNGHIKSSDSGNSPFHNLYLSLDPTTISLALGERPVKSIEPNGVLVYEETKTSNAILSEQLGRVWDEYPNGLLDLTEEKIESLSPEEDAVETKNEIKVEEKRRDPSKMMKWEEMEQLRFIVDNQLNDARNHLFWALELCRTLSVSSSFTSQPPPPPTSFHQKKAKAKSVQPPSSALSAMTDAPPVLPPGTYTTTPTNPKQKESHIQIFELEQLLFAKQKTLDECQTLIDGAVNELCLMADAGENFWRDVKSLKEGKEGRGRWAIVPKPDFGRVMGDGETAKDIIVPYAIDEGKYGFSTRTRCLAGFDLDPTAQDSLMFSARHRLRFRVTLSDTSGVVTSSAPVEMENESDVRSKMEAAQMEAFDEDLLNEIRSEASDYPKNVTEPHFVSVPVANCTLSFELYDPKSSSSLPSSPLCDIILSAARLALINAHRQRKTNLVAPTLNYTSRVPTILKPILDALRFRQLCKVVQLNPDFDARGLLGTSRRGEKGISEWLYRVMEAVEQVNIQQVDKN
nr:hypothetical protein L204_02476 [Cryptococcus depauperatus CBS 7855]